MWDAYARVNPPVPGDMVMLTRPDLIWDPRQGPGFARASAGAAALLPGAEGSAGSRMVWPFRCENHAWVAWKCTADTLVTLPGMSLATFYDQCVGMVRR